MSVEGSAVMDGVQLRDRSGAPSVSVQWTPFNFYVKAYFHPLSVTLIWYWYVVFHSVTCASLSHCSEIFLRRQKGFVHINFKAVPTTHTFCSCQKIFKNILINLAIIVSVCIHEWGPVSGLFYLTVRLARACVSEWKRTRFEMDCTSWLRPIGQITFLFAWSFQLVT